MFKNPLGFYPWCPLSSCAIFNDMLRFTDLNPLDRDIFRHPRTPHLLLHNKEVSKFELITQECQVKRLEGAVWRRTRVASRRLRSIDRLTLTVLNTIGRGRHYSTDLSMFSLYNNTIHQTSTPIRHRVNDLLCFKKDYVENSSPVRTSTQHSHQLDIFAVTFHTACLALINGLPYSCHKLADSFPQKVH